jgi:hypothetical protein
MTPGNVLHISTIDESNLSIIECNLIHSWLLVEATGQANVFVQNLTGHLEFDFNNLVSANLIGCNDLLIWLPVEDDSRLTISPPSSPVNRWSFPEDALLAENITSELSINNCSDVHWGCKLYSGGRLNISNSNMDALDLILSSSQDFQGLGAVKFHSNYLLPLNDMGELRLSNSSISNWCVTATDDAIINLDHPALWRLTQRNSSRINILSGTVTNTNSLIRLYDNAELNCSSSLLDCQIIMDNNTKLRLHNNSTITGNAFLYGLSASYLSNSIFTTNPWLDENARWMSVSLENPNSAKTGEVVSLTASIQGFIGYNLDDAATAYSFNITTSAGDTVNSGVNIPFSTTEVQLSWIPEAADFYTVTLEGFFLNEIDPLAATRTVYAYPVINIDEKDIEQPISVKYNSQNIEITGLPAGKPYRIFDIRGRIIRKGTTSTLTRLDLQQAPYKRNIYWFNYGDNFNKTTKIIIYAR